MNWSFLFRTAIADAKTQWGKLFLFISSIVLGIAALVAINSFNDNIVKDIDRQSASILGADIVISGNKKLPTALEPALKNLPGEKAYEYELLSMAFVPKNEGSQFVRIKALDGDFPFYGKLITEPPSAAQEFKSKGGVLVDKAFMKQFSLVPGDEVKLGDETFTIEGRLMNNMGAANLAAGFAPVIYLPFDQLDKTNLVQPGSMVDYSYFHKTPPEFDDNLWKQEYRSEFSNESMRINTIDDQRENLNEAFNSLNSFLNLVALVSLLLGCIGVASSVFIYVKNKISSIAIFRCLGMKSNQAFIIYFLQILVLGVLGSILGAAFGSGIQLLLPKVFSDFLPFQVVTEISWPSIVQGLSLGLFITVLFALIPLLEIRKISPLRTLRSNFTEEGTGRRDPLVWLCYAAIVICLTMFLFTLTGSILDALVFMGGILAAFFILYFVSKLIIWAVRKFFPRHWSFVLRQGLSNLYRPNNQTQILLVSLGLGTSILSTLFIVQSLILENVNAMDAGAQPNMILFGIETNQMGELKEKTKSFDMPVVEEVPIVTMRLEGWKGRTKKEWLQDTTVRVRRWAANRETRVTYRDTLDSSEKLISGNFIGQIENPGDSIFISLDEGYANSLNVELGDEMVFNVQGMLLTTYVSSFREIEFASMRTRFFVLFPRGVLEQAPQFQVLVTKAPNEDVMADYRTDVVKAFPNVSVVDLSSILTTLNDILKKISYAVQFMAGFSILTGLIVLLSSLILSKFQRVRESVLLRTLGASRAQILKINATEYLLIGVLAAFTGILISLVSSWLVVKFQLDFEYKIRWLPIVLVFGFVVIMTLFIGLWTTRDVVNKSPLETLRKDIQ